MHINHVAIWTENIEQMKDFYTRYFSFTPNDIYLNAAKGFSSYFLSGETGARLELMHRHDIHRTQGEHNAQYIGLAHLAFSVGSRDRVDSLTATLRADGFTILDGPRQTGDGYYESVALDPENNRIEITI
jgi:lactoylglutathione lyase